VSFSAAGQCTVAGATVTLTGAGSCALTASQAGSANYLPAPDVAQTFTIAKSPTSTSVSSNGNPSNAGQTVTFTATVTTSAGLATGSVTFLDGSVVLGTEPLTGGQASLSTGSLAVGMHAITAQYSGDADRLGSTSTVLTQAVLTTGADLVTTSVTNPPATSAPGLAFAVTDTVLNQGTGVAGSSVTRYFLSTDGVARTRLLSGSRSVGSLGPSQTSVSVGTSVQVPNGTALGTYYLLACADDTLRVTESNGTNNCRASISRVQVTP
jgi:hypothetical protein